ncbi:phosphoacetylglucosamine mutase-like [Mercurialis annua]|uniref:phosphoacetylglucosamine mutase-like n=1 Tax=Mercurialis annua TaxID=3986 RepID=UPI00215E654D|nr:phosphoacetylglucosamine mutase-like [Mercurialis annua]
MLNVSYIDICNSGKDGGVLNERVGADYVQKEKVVPHGFDSENVGIRKIPPGPIFHTTIWYRRCYACICRGVHTRSS